MNASTISCPNCGYGFENLRKSTRMFDCPSCQTTLFRDADDLAPAGKNGEMHETPMLFGIGDMVRTADGTFEVVGHLRYDYGRGFWDEMWAEDPRGNGVWISIDEGDVVLQRALPDGMRPDQSASGRIGEKFWLDGTAYTTTEADEAKLIAFRGQLPEQVEMNETHRFLNASASDGRFVSGEMWDGGEAWYVGEWLDPFELKITKGGFA